MLTGTVPFGKLSGTEVAIKVIEGERPSKPANALKLGLSDKVWKLLEECWQAERTIRPLVKDVLSRVKAAALGGGILSPTGSISERYEGPLSAFNEYGRSLHHA